MLKNIPKHLSPDVLWALAAMGHGDCLVVVDANYPAYSRRQRVLPIVGVPLVSIITDILKLMPVDDFLEKPVVKMVPDGDLGYGTSVHDDVEKIVNEIEQRGLASSPLRGRDSTMWRLVHLLLSRLRTIDDLDVSFSQKASSDLSNSHPAVQFTSLFMWSCRPSSAGSNVRA
jgi:L-fucose mutarotase